ncbi:MAG: phospho-N-acetylmuramoyl-pentapeptide-transferase [Anaerolineaceae bacterium]|nr:phospho-N-acetylmuramoyl-pentapeptide-transferase [Anaerolineaceae bacterium]
MKETSMALSLSLIGFVMAVIWGGPFIRMLKHFKIGKLIRLEGPKRHMTKMGTPTMGGLMIILPVLFITVLLNFVSLVGVNLFGNEVFVPLITLVLFGILGAIDDWEGIRGPRKQLGMRARTKFAFQVIFAVAIALLLRYYVGVPQLFWPGVNQVIRLDPFYVPIAAFMIVGMSNAVNFTDGLDGLAGLITATALAAYGGIAIMQGQDTVARFCFTLVGALFGFLWFNVHPAALIMGDTGSLAIGAVLAVIALMTGQWMLIPIIAIIPVSEAVSVILQIGYFKLTKGKRLFKMAPLHHHFELLGWSETQVVQRFWLIGLLFAIIGIAVALA